MLFLYRPAGAKLSIPLQKDSVGHNPAVAGSNGLAAEGLSDALLKDAQATTRSKVANNTLSCSGVSLSLPLFDILD